MDTRLKNSHNLLLFKEKGFTLLELILTIVLISLLQEVHTFLAFICLESFSRS